MKNILFETKEDYLKFKKHWANYFNTEARNLDTDCDGLREVKLTASHFVLYAIIRGASWEKAISTCSSDTMDMIESDIKSSWFYMTKTFKAAFELDDDQVKMLREAVRDFPTLEEVSEPVAIAQ